MPLARLLAFIFISVFVCSALFSAHADDSCDNYKGLLLEPTHQPPTLKRGINLSRWWENDQDQKLDSDDIKNLGALGFDFVRLPVSPKWFESDEAGARKDLRCDVISLLNAGFTVILDFHPDADFEKKIDASSRHATARLTHLWETMAPVLSGLPPARILLGLYNEPDMDPDLWWRTQGALIKNLRPLFPNNTFIVTSAPESGPWTLAQQKPYMDRNLIYDFHYYMPLFLTHHGADWFGKKSPLRKTNSISYPTKPDDAILEKDPDVKKYMKEGWNRTKLAEDIDEIAAWRDRYHTVLACLEFGIYRPYNDEESRLHWLGDMRSILEADHVPWALWEYRGGFGLMDQHDNLDEGMAKTLGLSHNNPP